jgi:hypothetical protein
MTWNNFGKPIEHEGVIYGTKEREFEMVESLPSRTRVQLELAIGGQPPLERLRHAGWRVVGSQDVSRTSDDYRHYIQRSRGEFSVAKNLYVATRSGWFSCRSVCYLAAGRPAVLQDTGFSKIIPCGDGLIAFTSLDGAAEGIERVERDYAAHSRAARRVAEDCFDSRIVLNDLLHQTGIQ